MRTPRFTHLLAIGSTIALLASCTHSPGWFSEAGSTLDTGSFGDATMNNTGVHSGDRSYVVNLANRFSVEVPDTVNFTFNSALLDEPSRAILRQQATWIRQFPEVRFKVFGHTDLVGSNAYNKALGLRRARAVVSYLSSQGISRSRLEAVVSQGENQPVVVTQDRERRNRRTVTEVTGFVQNHPLVLNGKYAQVIFREYVTSALPPSGLDGAELASSD